jgi:hypothetical protein
MEAMRKQEKEKLISDLIIKHSVRYLRIPKMSFVIELATMTPRQANLCLPEVSEMMSKVIRKSFGEQNLMAQ